MFGDKKNLCCTRCIDSNFYELFVEEQEMEVEFDAVFESENQRLRREIHQTLTVALGD